MNIAISSKERMLEAIAGRKPDYVPCSFMIFHALRSRCQSVLEFVECQVEMGLDTKVELPFEPALWYHADMHGLPIRFHPQVKINEWKESRPGEPYPVLCKEYYTPVGTLRTEVSKTEDWPYGDRVPFMDDYLIPRSLKPLVTSPKDLEALKYLLMPPSDEDVRAFKKEYTEACKIAEKHGLLISGGWGAGIDAAAWLCGIQPLILLAMDQPEFTQELMSLIGEWNKKRMEPFLDVGVDLFVRRGWYEGADLWSPALFRKLVFPYLKQEVELAHQAGVKFGYILTAGVMPVVDIVMEAGVDVLIGIDPVQDRTMDMLTLKKLTDGKIGLWGGVNGFLTVEMGTPDRVREAVEKAIGVLGKGGGFILSPVDNVREDTPRVWRNIRVFIETWRVHRTY